MISNTFNSCGKCFMKSICVIHTRPYFNGRNNVSANSFTALILIGIIAVHRCHNSARSPTLYLWARSHYRALYHRQKRLIDSLAFHGKMKEILYVFNRD